MPSMFSIAPRQDKHEASECICAYFLNKPEDLKGAPVVETVGGGGGRLRVNQTTWTENNLALVVQRVDMLPTG